MSDILTACLSGYELLLVYLRLYGMTVKEISRELHTYENRIHRDLQRIRDRF